MHAISADVREGQRAVMIVKDARKFAPSTLRHFGTSQSSD